MRVKKSKRRQIGEAAEGDMTPMIDMVFQLIAFFMVLINFSQAEQQQRINLPSSELAKPPEQGDIPPITLHVDDVKDNIIFKGNTYNLTELGRAVNMYASARKATTSAKEIPVIIRGDKKAKTGFVQQVIKSCQEQGFEEFKLRARQEKAAR